MGGILDRAGSDLGPLEILKDTNRDAELIRKSAEILNDDPVFVRRSMGEVQAGHVHSSLNEAAELFR